MFLYENNECPVCGKFFEQGEDVVVCPECGTPHHRECYQSHGRCANKKLHGTEFVFKRTAAKNTADAKKDASLEDFFANADAMSSNSREYKTENNIYSEKSESLKANHSVAAGNTCDSEIDGVKISDITTVVGVNNLKFLKKFSKSRKIGWNWSAFFFGPYYYLYRKMYLESLIFISLPMLVSFVIGKVFAPAVKTLNEIITQANSYIMSYEAEKAYEYINNAVNAPENRQVLKVILLTFGISVLIRIVSAVIADLIYRKKVVKIIRTVDERLEEDDSFSLMGNFFTADKEMGKNDMRRMILAKQGGVNTFIPFLLIMLFVFATFF